jgi:hypothetical protein
MGGGVDYWIGLPISEMVKYLVELSEQLRRENEQAEEASKRGR